MEGTKSDGTESRDKTTDESEATKQRSFGQVLSRFADMTSMGGVGYIKNSKLRKAKVIWSILLFASIVALSVHLYTSLKQFYSYPKTAKINLGFVNLHFPEITICNVNPVSKRRLEAYNSSNVEPLKRLIKALEPQAIAPEQFNDSMSYSDIAGIYSAYGSYDYDYYDNFWDNYGSSQFYDNYEYYYYDYYYDYYNSYYYDYYSSSGSGEYGDSGSSGENTHNDYYGDDNSGNNYFYNYDWAQYYYDNGAPGNDVEHGGTGTGIDGVNYDEGDGNPVNDGGNGGNYDNYDYDRTQYYYDNEATGNDVEHGGSGTGTGIDGVNYDEGVDPVNDDGAGGGITESGSGGTNDTQNDDGNTNQDQGSGETPPTEKRRKKRYAELYDHFNFTEFDPTFDKWFRQNNEELETNEFRAKVDTSTKIDALFRKTFMNLARWERGRLGHDIKKMLLKCTFAGRTCDEKKLFRLHQTPEYGNCWTLSSRKFVAQDAGPNAGLSLVLNLQSIDYLPAITHGYGARIQIHNRGAYPDPFQDGISLPASMETSIGLKLVTFERLSGHYGDCEDGELFRRQYKRPYTRRTCQVFCHAESIIKTCGCYDEHTEEVAVNTGIGTGLKACNTVEQYDCIHRIKDLFERKEIQCSCRNPCKESAFTKSITGHQWPTDDHAKLLLAGICAEDAGACKSFLSENNTISTVYNNFLKLNIYFEDLNYEEIVEEPDIGIAQILSDVGGAIGLWIGLSVVSFCEIVQLIVELVRLLRHKIRDSQRLKRQKAARKRKASDKQWPSHFDNVGPEFVSVHDYSENERYWNESPTSQRESRNENGNVLSISNRRESYGYNPFGPVRAFNDFPGFGSSRFDQSLTGRAPFPKRSRY